MQLHSPFFLRFVLVFCRSFRFFGITVVSKLIADRHLFWGEIKIQLQMQSRAARKLIYMTERSVEMPAENLDFGFETK